MTATLLFSLVSLNNFRSQPCNGGPVYIRTFFAQCIGVSHNKITQILPTRNIYIYIFRLCLHCARLYFLQGMAIFVSLIGGAAEAMAFFGWSCSKNRWRKVRSWWWCWSLRILEMDLACCCCYCAIGRKKASWVAFLLLVLAGKKEELLVGAAWWRQEQRRIELPSINDSF
ncbi:hypothetical protein PVAP13_6KG365012 [Panicum virgatum]|uniref:Uncharacterized protein n=1 Tax=Panicum virgatum TaxID=38727 RepID=A0A8T0RIS1_PANVG|nr:hypothetical protein PVAP13_6KG365012 [Panicum virgatum]